MKKVVIYIRVSIEERATQGKSLETQQQVLTDYAKEHDLEIVRTFEESHSAYKTGRPEFHAMIGFLRKQNDVSGILCYKIDRLSRDTQDFSLLEEMEGVEMISVTDPSLEGSADRLIGCLSKVMARLYSDQASKRVKDGCRTKAANGIYPGRAPTGYVKNTVKKTLEPDPTMAPIVTKLFEMYASEDITLSQLVCRAKSLGLRTKRGCVLRKSALRRLLSNPIYQGGIRWEGEFYPGLHEPIVPVALFNTVQDRFNGSSSLELERGDRSETCIVCRSDISEAIMSE